MLEQEPDLREQPDPDYHYIKASSMRNIRREYIFRRGKPPTKAPDSKRAVSRRPSFSDTGWDPNTYRQEFRQSLVQESIQEGYASTIEHAETALEHGQAKPISNGHSPLTHVSETPLRGGLDGNRR